MTADPYELIKRWKIFPCNEDKTPACASWPKDATNDPAKIAEWIKRLHPSRWGIPAVINGFFAVDIDLPDGEITMNEWISRHGSAGAGISQITPSGGAHLLYTLPDGVRVPNNAGKIGKGIDLRSDGYIATGDGYKWQDGSDYTAELKPAPGWLLDKIRALTKKDDSMDMRISITPPSNPTAEGERLLKVFLSKAAPGQRNPNGFDFACQLRDAGLSKGDAESYMRRYQAGVPQPAGNHYSIKEAMDSLREAYSRAPRPPASQLKKQRTQMAEYIEPEQPPDEPEQPPEEDAPLRPVTLPTAGDILKTEFPEPVWIVPGYIPAGFTILAGRPKIGKSWMALQIAQGVDSGGKIFDQDVKKGKVLYLALEDSPRRLKRRMEKQGWSNNSEANMLTMEEFRNTIGYLNKGGAYRLQQLIEANGYRFVVIDVITRAVIGIKDFNNNAEVSAAFAPIQEVSNKMDIGVLGLDHHNKVFSQDPIDDVTGSTAKSSIADSIIGLYTEQGKRGATFKGRGRDMEEFDKRIVFDKPTGAWQVEGDTDAVRISESEHEIISALRILNKPTKASSVAAYLGAKRSNTSARLKNMMDKGLVTAIDIDSVAYYEVMDES